MAARRMGWGLAFVGAVASLAASCGGSIGASGSSCQMICEKRNSCATSASGRVPCDQICVYGGNYYPGLAPSPVCPNLAAQTSCVQAAVAMSCDTYSDVALACPPCGVLDGAPCASNADCQKYQSNYLCDLSRPGGYCTTACVTAYDCSLMGPEVCTTTASPPSFDPSAPTAQTWCMLGCSTGAACRTSDGYACVNNRCDVP